LGGLSNEIGDSEKKGEGAANPRHKVDVAVKQVWRLNQASCARGKNLMGRGCDATVCGHCAVMVELADTLL
jgi:hypothetical protein